MTEPREIRDVPSKVVRQLDEIMGALPERYRAKAAIRPIEDGVRVDWLNLDPRGRELIMLALLDGGYTHIAWILDPGGPNFSYRKVTGDISELRGMLAGFYGDEPKAYTIEVDAGIELDDVLYALRNYAQKYDPSIWAALGPEPLGKLLPWAATGYVVYNPTEDGGKFTIRKE